MDNKLVDLLDNELFECSLCTESYHSTEGTWPKYCDGEIVLDTGYYDSMWFENFICYTCLE